MLVISNDCMAGHLYVKYNQIFNHPFMWCVIPYDDMNYMMQNFHKIHYQNITLKPNNYIKKNTVLLTIDNVIRLYAIHLFTNNNKKSIERNGGNLIGPAKEIYKYASDTYYRRLERMSKVSEDPIFVIHEELPSSKPSVLRLQYSPYKVFTLLSKPTIKQHENHIQIDIPSRQSPHDDMQYLLDAFNTNRIQLP